MNVVILCGRLTKDPEIRQTTTTTIASYALAVERRKRAENGEKGVDFINVKTFSQGADFAQKYLHKGTKIIVRGRIETGKYTNREEQTVYTTDVIADEQELAESKAAAEKANTDDVKNQDDFAPINDAVADPGLPFN